MSRVAAKAIVLLSGGIDSAVCLWWAREQGFRLISLTFNYHRRHPREIEAAANLARMARVEEQLVVDLPFLRELQDGALSADNPLQADLDALSGAYIPARNTVFYGIAASWAERLGARYVVGGHHKEDASLFPDATPQYFALFNELLRRGTVYGQRYPLELVTPLATLAKHEVVLYAHQLGVPLELTWSCYERGEVACGTCAACVERREAFHTLGLPDPMLYAAPSAAAGDNVTGSSG